MWCTDDVSWLPRGSGGSDYSSVHKELQTSFLGVPISVLFLWPSFSLNFVV